ncbi:hypothetical protein DM02DRAFT_619751 [Periconia macrospinosa]|uniref:Zn(2)-C6 fungal-type domain-containing protein n=1 Tax=Periconia macrospinosa TaxID=97972 RepID=A0A2V1D410_9PLEO|nr:hypothetical protein DM02DRAFT_619751 [Periconia macrospinosa]
MSSVELRSNVRLRQSCDRCSSAKVRCDKKQPACERCINNQLQCSYSESRRHGKQSWQKRVNCERMKAAAAASATTVTTTMTAAMNTPTSMSTGENIWDSSGHDYTINRSTTGRVGSIDVLDATQLWAPNDDFMTDFDINNFTDPPLLVSTAYELSALTYPVTGVSLAETLTTGEGLETTVTSSLLPTTRIHDCEADAISVLRSLHHTSAPDVTPQPGTSSHSNSGSDTADLAPTFDKALTANRAALNGWSELMKCPCARCPHLTFLYVSILSKIIFWYRVAASENIPLSGTTRTSTSGSSNSVSSSSNNSTMQNASLPVPPRVGDFGIRPTVVQVGMLDLDHEDQASVRRIVLLRELRRVEKAIDDIAKVDHTIADDDADEAAYRAVERSTVAISGIREELQELIQKVRGNRWQ